MNKIASISLIELLVTMSILVILTKISFGAFYNLQIENRRQEAHSELIKLKSNLEQMAVSGYFKTTPVQSIMDVVSIPEISSKSITSPNGYYELTISGVDTTLNKYVLTATAKGIQAEKDSACLNITLTVTAEQEDQKLPQGCW